MGVGIVLISDDLDELLALSHRVAVMRAGTLVHTADVNEIDRSTVLHLVTVGRST